MASMRRDVLQDGKVRHRARVRVRGRSAHGTFPTKAEARRWAADKEREFSLDRLTPLGQSEVVTFGDLVERYRRQSLPFKKWHTQRQQEQQLAWWVEYFGDQAPLVAITPPKIADVKEKLQPLSAATINRYLAVLSHVFTVAVKEWRCCEANPVLAVTRLPEGRGRTRWLRSDERQRLMYHCAASSNRLLHTIVTVALSTGARASEIRNMRWDMLDLFRTMNVDGRTVEVGRYFLEAADTKTDEARALILFGESLELMRKLHRARKPGERFCFPSEREPRRPLDFRYAWERALEKADIANFCFHDLRHSAASYLGEQGASLAQIGAILGHKNPATTKKYTHFTASGTEHLVARMNNSLWRRE